MEGLSAFQVLETCLFHNHEHTGRDKWLDYVEAAKEMIFVLQEYSTVPDTPGLWQARGEAGRSK
jgi:hypothetical protein